jgi:hypothetical protein
VSKQPERRSSERREVVDLTRPAYLERRARGGTRRQADEQRLAEAEAALPESVRVAPAEPAAVGVEPSKPLEQLEADLAALQQAMDGRTERLKGLSEEDFQRSQVRHESLMIAWSVQVRRLQDEIAAARRALVRPEQPDT